MMPKLDDIYKQIAEQTASQSPEDTFYSQPITPNQQRSYRGAETEVRRTQNQLEMQGVDVGGELKKSEPGMMSTLLDPIFDMLQVGQFVTAGAALEIQKGGMAKEALKRAASEFANALPGLEVEDVFQIGNEQFPKATRPSWSEVLKKSEVEFFNNQGYGKWSAAAGGLALDILLDPITYVNPIGAVAKVPEVASFLKGAKTLVQEGKYSKPIYEDLGRKFVKDFDLKEYARRNPEKAASVTRFIENMGIKEAETEAGLQAVRDNLLNVTKDMNAAEFRLMVLYMQDPKMLRDVVEIATLQAPERKTEILTKADELRKFFLDLGEEEVELGLLSPAAFKSYTKDKIYVPGRDPSTPKGELASDELRARLGFMESGVSHPSTSGEIGRNMQMGTGTPTASKEKVFKTIVERLVSGTPTDLDVTLAAKRGIESVRWQATKRLVDSVISDPDVSRIVPKGDIANLFDMKQEDLVAKLISEGLQKEEAEAVATKQFDELSGYLSRLKKEGFGLYRPLRKGEDVFVMPEPFINELDMTDKLLSGKNETLKFLKQWNSLQTIWKGYAVLSPGFHARNMFSNWWNNALGGVSSPDPYYKAYLLQRGQGGDISIKVGDKIMQAEEIMNEAIRHGIVGTGIVNKDLGLDLEKQILNSLSSRSSGRELGEQLRKRGEKFSLAADVAETAPQRTAMDVVKNIVGSDNALLKGNRLVGRAIENNARLAHFIDKLGKGHSIQQAAQSTKKYLFDYCFDEETEILTSEGWKKWYEIRAELQVLTMNMDRDCLEWKQIEGINIQNYSGPMHYWKSSRFDAVTTPEHKWIVYGDKEKHGDHRKTIDRTLFSLLPSRQIHDYSHAIKVVCENYNPGIKHKKYSDVFVELIGWVLTEGNYSHAGKSIQVYQSERKNPHKTAQLRNCWTNIQAEEEGTYTEYAQNGNGIVSFYIGRALSHKIIDMFPDKQLTVDFLRDLSVNQLEILYNTLIITDGHKKGNMDFFTQKGDSFAGAFQVLCFMLGKRSKIYKKSDLNGNVVNSVSVYSSKDVYINETKRDIKEYIGKIWCISTSNKTVIARRGGTVYLSGNSELTDFERTWMKAFLPFYAWMRHNIPLQFQSLVQQPGRYAALSAKPMQEIESLSSDWRDIPTPDYFQEIRAVRLPKEATEGVAYLNNLFKDEETGLQPIFLNPNLPFQDVNRLNLKDFAAGLSPLPKMLIEEAPTKGFSFFLDRDIERYPGEPSPVDVLGTGVTLTGKRESMARSALPTYGKIQRLRERYKQGQFASQLLTEIAGLKAIQVDIAKANRDKTYHKRDTLRNLKRQLQELGRIP